MTPIILARSVFFSSLFVAASMTSPSLYGLESTHDSASEQEQSFTLTGRCLDLDGEPVANQWLKWGLGWQAGEGVSSTRFGRVETNGNGEFELSPDVSLESDLWGVLHLAQESEATDALIWSRKYLVSFHAGTVNLADLSPSNVPGALVVRLVDETGEPVVATYCELFTRSPTGGAVARGVYRVALTSNATGRAYFDSHSSELDTLVESVPGFWGDLTVEAAGPGFAIHRELLGEWSKDELTLVMKRIENPARISGSIVMPPGALAHLFPGGEHPSVFVQQLGDTPWQCGLLRYDFVGDSIEFNIEWLTAGTYSLRVGFSPSFVNPDWIFDGAPPSFLVDLDSSELHVAEPIDLRESLLCALVNPVDAESGQPLPGALVSIRDPDCQGVVMRGGVLGAPPGRVVMAFAKSIELRVEAKGYYPVDLHDLAEDAEVAMKLRDQLQLRVQLDGPNPLIAESCSFQLQLRPVRDWSKPRRDRTEWQAVDANGNTFYADGPGEWEVRWAIARGVGSGRDFQRITARAGRTRIKVLGVSEEQTFSVPFPSTELIEKALKKLD